MKSINLIPKVPFIKQHFGWLMAGILVATAGTLLTLTVVYVSTAADIQDKRALRDKQTQRAASLMKERIMDPETVQYQAMLKEIEQLKPFIRDWQPVFDSLTTSLPVEARITSVDTKAEGTMNLHLEMKDLNDAADYLVRLQQSGLYTRVTVKNVQLKELQLESEQTPAPGNTPFPSSTPAPDGSSTKSMTYEDYVKKFRKEPSSVGPVSESDELLNQLDWVLSQKISSQKNGIALPDRVSNEVPQSQGIITQKDFDDARKKLNEIENVTITNSDSAPAGTVSVEAAGSVPLFDVDMELKLKPLLKEK